MLNVLTRAGCFIAIILLGYLLKMFGLFKDSDFSVLSKIVLKITLPAVIITNFANKELDPSMFIFTFLSILFGGIYILLGFLFNLGRSKEQKAFEILNFPGYNIGCFALPFVQSFLGPTGVIATSLFDTGNAVICLGGAYGVAASVKEGSGFNIKRIIKGLATSVPFMTHFIMVTLNLLHLSPPAPIVSFAQIVGSGNAFLAMLMISVGFKLSGDKSQAGAIARVLGVRYSLAAVLALCFYFLLPFALEVRQALVILAFSPIGSAVPVFTAELKGDVGLSSAINSIAILISIVIIVTLLLVML